jgi:hypothetical protein
VGALAVPDDGDVREAWIGAQLLRPAADAGDLGAEQARAVVARGEVERGGLTLCDADLVVAQGGDAALGERFGERAKGLMGAGSRAELPSRSVGPLPTTSSATGKGPGPPGVSSVP